MQLQREDLPPVISILLAEKAPDDDLASALRWYRRLSPEVRRQAEWSRGHFAYTHPRMSAGSLIAAPAGGLDPCRGDAICIRSECRLKAAHQFARTLGLYADHVVLADEPTVMLLATPRFSARDAYAFANSARVLHALRPMIDAGLISFRNTHPGYCEVHYKQFAAAIDEATRAILKELNLPLRLDVQDRGAYLDLTALAGYPNGRMLTKRELARSGRRTLESIASRYLHSSAQFIAEDAAIIVRDATEFNGTFFSSSRLSTMLLRRLDGSTPNATDLNVWEHARSMDLPWIRDLTIGQIVQLREVAADALPRLRETLRFTLPSGGVSDGELTARIQNIREQAAEVKAELKALRSRHETIFRNVAGFLGLTISVYGFGADILPVAPALASLMTLLGLLHTSEHKDFTEIKRLQSKPGYVLVKAQELLDHAP